MAMTTHDIAIAMYAGKKPMFYSDDNGVYLYGFFYSQKKTIAVVMKKREKKMKACDVIYASDDWSDFIDCEGKIIFLNDFKRINEGGKAKNEDKPNG